MAWPCLQQAGHFATAPVPAKLVDSHLKCYLYAAFVQMLTFLKGYKQKARFQELFGSLV